VIALIKVVQGLAFEAAIHRFRGHFRLRWVRRAFDVNRQQKLFFFTRKRQRPSFEGLDFQRCSLAPRPGLEPGTYGLTVENSRPE
jgi:hypothetical protein